MRVIRWAPLCSRPQLYHAASLPNVFFYDICFVVGLFVGLLVDVRLGRILFFSRSIRRFFVLRSSIALFFFFFSFYLSTRTLCTCPGIQCWVTELRATFEGRCCRRLIPPPGVVLGRLRRQVVKKNGKDPRISLYFLGLSAVSRQE